MSFDGNMKNRSDEARYRRQMAEQFGEGWDKPVSTVAIGLITTALLVLVVLGLLVFGFVGSIASSLGVVEFEDPAAKLNMWSGTYECADGPRSMTVQVNWPDGVTSQGNSLPVVVEGTELEVTGTAIVDDNANETRPSNSVRTSTSMVGTFDGSALRLRSIRPSTDIDDHLFTELTGIVVTDSLAGTTNSGSCGEFTLAP